MSRPHTRTLRPEGSGATKTAAQMRMLHAHLARAPPPHALPCRVHACVCGRACSLLTAHRSSPSPHPAACVCAPVCVLKLDLERLAQLMLFVADDFAEAGVRYRRQSVEAVFEDHLMETVTDEGGTERHARHFEDGPQAAEKVLRRLTQQDALGITPLQRAYLCWQKTGQHCSDYLAAMRLILSARIIFEAIAYGAPGREPSRGVELLRKSSKQPRAVRGARCNLPLPSEAFIFAEVEQLLFGQSLPEEPFRAGAGVLMALLRDAHVVTDKAARTPAIEHQEETSCRQLATVRPRMPTYAHVCPCEATRPARGRRTPHREGSCET